MLTVAAEDPLKEPVESPVPNVNELGVAAVTVVEPPRLTAFPLIVTELFVSPAFGIVETAVTALVPLPTK
jgi:hypothetical protein